MEAMKLKLVAALCGAACPPEQEDRIITGVSTDTRTIAPGDLFVPLTGPNFDGHDYLNVAAEKGAAAALTARQTAASLPLLPVEDTLAALQRLAGEYRRQFTCPVVGITGSVGKTSTKEMMASVLSQRLRVTKTEGNFNNEIGVPHTLLSMSRQTEAAVVEMGINHFGEMSRLTAMVNPQIAVITCIGVNHLEFLGSRQGIARAKLEILEGLRPGGTLVINGDEPLLRQAEGLPPSVVTFGLSEENDYYPLSVTVKGEHQQLRIHTPEGDLETELPVLGIHHVKNALAAAAVGQLLGLNPEEMIRGIASFQNTGRRQRLCTVQGRRIIDDCYNAAPDSIAAALTVLDQMAGGKKVAALGCMLELGDAAPEAHRAVGAQTAKSCQMLLCYGPWAGDYVQGAIAAGMDPAQALAFDNHPALTEALLRQTEPGDVILLKGSRGMHMEEVLRLLEEEDGGTGK